MKRTVRKIGKFSVGSFGIYPPGNLRGDELMTLWAVEPDYTRQVKECYPSLPANKYLYPSRSMARAIAKCMGKF